MSERPQKQIVKILGYSAHLMNVPSVPKSHFNSVKIVNQNTNPAISNSSIVITKINTNATDNITSEKTLTSNVNAAPQLLNYVQPPTATKTQAVDQQQATTTQTVDQQQGTKSKGKRTKKNTGADNQEPPVKQKKTIEILGEFFENVVNKGTFNVCDHINLNDKATNIVSNNNSTTDNQQSSGSNGSISTTLIRALYDKSNTDKIVDAIDSFGSVIKDLTNEFKRFNNLFDNNNNLFNSFLHSSSPINQSKNRSSNLIDSSLPPSAQKAQANDESDDEEELHSQVKSKYKDLKLINEERLLDLYQNKVSEKNFAVRVFRELFPNKSDYINKNVYGVTNHKGIGKERFDPDKINYVKHLITRFCDYGGRKENEFIAECITEINKYISNTAQKQSKRKLSVSNKENAFPAAEQDDEFSLL